MDLEEWLSAERCLNMGPFGDVQETPFLTAALLKSDGYKLPSTPTRAYRLVGAEQGCAEGTQASRNPSQTVDT